jgi:molecular chaperone HscB
VSAALDHFARLDLPRAVRLDRGALETAYLERSARWHPDRVATADGPTRTRAMLEASALNEAYATLRDPVKRAEYLCRLAGIDIETATPATAFGTVAPANERSRVEHGGALRPARHPGSAFLGEMIELRERLDDLDSDEARDELLEEMERECSRLRENALSALDAERVDDAADALVRLRYVSRFRDEVAAALDGG